jgi:60 kDa SS-A/Ro ribonucleoprotein
MAKNLAKHVNSGTSQTEQARADQVKNNAGGYVFQTTQMEQLRRFLILGSTGGSYYCSEKKLTKDNIKNIIHLFNDEKTGIEAVDEIVRVSDEGIAPKNDPALFAMAVACSSPNDKVRGYALHNLDRVARIGTHLFTFLTYLSEE